MSLETVHSKSALLEYRSDLLSKALLLRRCDVRDSWKEVLPEKCLQSLGRLGWDVTAFLSEGEPASRATLPAGFKWLTCEGDFWSNLQAVALGQTIECRPAAPPGYLPAAKIRELPAKERFALLCARYQCPWNIGAPSEIDVAEEILRRLMVSDRAKIEKGAEFDVDGVLLGLNLLAVRALVARDLRSFDALNYFYELPRKCLARMRENPRPLAFWLCLYKQVLSTPDWLECALP